MRPAPAKNTLALSTGLFLFAMTIVAATGAPGPSMSGGQGTATSPLAPQGRSIDDVWTVVGQRSNADLAQGRSLAGQHAVVQLNRQSLFGLLQLTQMETLGSANTSAAVLTLPMPDGTFSRFRIEESPMLSPELAAAFPAIRTYHGQGIDDPTATTRFGWTDAGFHAIVLSEAGSVYVDPYAPGDLGLYVSYRKADSRQDAAGFVCLVGGDRATAAQRNVNSFPISHGDTFRVYRLALSATGEYTAAAGGTKALALARMTTTMNRVNGIYERELSVRMTVATGTPGDPTALIFTDGTTDPFTNDNTNAMLTENQTTVDGIVGTANYDMGHVFSTGGGGIAWVGSPCDASLKAGGVTGLPNPTGDAFDVDYVSHELGHQFGGNHSFNGSTLSCSTRSPLHAYEVGSGSTIQAYAGICGVENLQPNTSDRFHVESLNEITAFLTSGGGQSCGVTAPTANVPPSVNAGLNHTIPRLTPFVLTATGSDANGDALTYAWEEFDLGTKSTDVATASIDDGSRPLFRAYSPTSSASRTFPSLTYILNNANVPPITYACGLDTCLTGETVPSLGRTMTFQVTARDNRSGGGAFSTASTQVTVYDATGPFRMTSPNTAVSLAGGSNQTISWDVNGTNVLAANVRILLSTDGGSTFPTTIAASTANDGSDTVTIPNSATTQARIKIEAVGNIFFDISDTNFAITPGSTLPALTPSPTVLNFGAVNIGGTLVSATPPQQVTVSQSSGASVAWTASANVSWLTVAAADATGSGTGVFMVSLNNTGGVLPASGTVTGTVTITAPGARANPTVTVRATMSAGATTPPFGLVDTPLQNTTGVVGTIGVTGWVLDDVGVTGVKIYRNCLAFEPQANCVSVAGRTVVFVGDATLVTGARPDVEGLYPTYPQASRAAWGYLLLTNLLPHIPNAQMFGGQGTMALSVLATDVEGKRTWLGRGLGDTTPSLFTMANDTIAKPFGAIDTPAQGATVRGVIVNFGWALTPDLDTTAGPGDIVVPTTGTTITVFVDGVPQGTALYNQCRGTTVAGPVTEGVWCNDDVASIFGHPTPQATFAPRSSNVTKHRNLDVGRGAIGAFLLNSTMFSNGVHTIMWGVVDDSGRNDGIGSRFFTVLNTGDFRLPMARTLGVSAPEVTTAALLAAPAVSRGDARDLDSLAVSPDDIRGRTGIDLAVPFDVMPADESGVRHVQIPTFGRVELALGPVDAGYLVANGALRDLPVGSHLDLATGIFTWAPGPGFLGTYRLAFRRDGSQVPVAVTIHQPYVAAPGESPIRMHMDVPTSGTTEDGAFLVAGWALDPQAPLGSGIGAVHVWALRRDVPAAEPQFLGEATRGIARPDVAAVHGAGFHTAGFGLVAPALAPGEYDLMVFAWCARTGRWEDARTVAITVR